MNFKNTILQSGFIINSKFEMSEKKQKVKKKKLLNF